MSGIATEALKDVTKAEERLSAVNDELGRHREQFAAATKELEGEKADLNKLIASRLREAAAAYGPRDEPRPRRRASSGARGSIDEEAIVAWVRQQTQPVGAPDIAQGAGISASPSSLSRKLTSLVQAGLIKKTGEKRGTKYTA